MKKPQHLDFELVISAGRARLRAGHPERLPMMPFEAGCDAYRVALRTARARLVRAGYRLAAALPGAREATPLQVLMGRAPLPWRVTPPRTTTRARRIIVVCMHCDCRGDGGCKCKVVKCPENRV